VSHLLLVKYGELALKGRNRPDFERVLSRNIARALDRAVGRDGAGGRSWRLRKAHGRLMVELGPEAGGPAEAERLVGAAAKVFGVVGVALARRVGLDVEAIREAAASVAREAVRTAGARTFKVEVKRPNKSFPLTSPEAAAEVGRGVLRALPELSVDVHEPDLRIGVEIRDDGAYVYGREVPGPGGLPVGASGRAVALVSGGIDSPVAAWMAMKRGLVVIPLHFWSFPFTGERARQKVVDLCRVLGEWGPVPDLRVCPFTDIQTAIRDRCPEPLRITVMRRMMFRVAERLARAEEAPALVTGESLGQVASQTLESLAAIETVTTLPVLRPLIGLDKAEIIARARDIGTYEISIQPYEDCCTLFVPAHPRTRPSVEEAEAAEKALDVDRLVEEAVAGTERFRPEPAGRHPVTPPSGQERETPRPGE